MQLQSLIHAIYPPQCVMCDTRTDVDFALCGPCWVKTPFITGLACDGCGAPLLGEGTQDRVEHCDDCLSTTRPWSRGRAAMVYKDKARRMVLSIKHGDRTDLVRAAGPWMTRAADDLITPDTLIVPIPLHRMRLLRRRFNQASLLAQQVAKLAGVEVATDALLRVKKTAPLDGHTADQRYASLADAIEPNPNQLDRLKGRKILLVDDVMTSGATFSAATQACKDAGADDISVLALARVVKDA